MLLKPEIPVPPSILLPSLRRRATKEREKARQLDRQREDIHPSEVLSKLETLRPPPPASLRLPEAKPDPEKEYPVRHLAIRPIHPEEPL